MNIHYDKNLDIAFGNSRKTKVWKNKTVRWSELLDRFSTTTRTGETLAEYTAMNRDQQSARKDVGGFVGGLCKDGRRSSIAFRAPSSVWTRTLPMPSCGRIGRCCTAMRRRGIRRTNTRPQNRACGSLSRLHGMCRRTSIRQSVAVWQTRWASRNSTIRPISRRALCTGRAPHRMASVCAKMI